MANIQDRIKQLEEFFLSMNVAPGDGGAFLMYVEVAFPAKWTISKSIAEKYKVEIIPNEGKNGYYFLGDMALGHDAIFDCIADNIKLNQDSEKRVNLFREKQTELKALFEDMSIELSSLETLEFKMTAPRKSKLPKPTKAKEVAEDETIIVEETPENNE